jgi:hypothetical protein
MEGIDFIGYLNDIFVFASLSSVSRLATSVQALIHPLSSPSSLKST